MKMRQASKKGNSLWRYKTSRQNLISTLNSYDLQSQLDLKSDFGEQIYIKKLFQAVYGNHLIMPSVHKKFDLWDLISKNEWRLDVILFRSQLFQSLGSANQAIKNGKIFINGKVCLNAYHLLSVGTIISLCPKFFLTFIKTLDKKVSESMQNTLSVANHFHVDYKTATLILVSTPEEGDFPFLIS